MRATKRPARTGRREVIGRRQTPREEYLAYRKHKVGQAAAPARSPGRAGRTRPTEHRETLRSRFHKCGYELRTERITDFMPGAKPFTIVSAYAANGHYVGDAKMARFVFRKLGVVDPHPASCAGPCAPPDMRACGVGFSPRDGKWYGWSHRAYFGFGIGTRPLVLHPNQKTKRGPPLKTWAEARAAAVAFAESVS